MRSQLKVNQFKLSLLFGLANGVLLASGCTGLSAATGSSTTTGITGTVSAGPLNAATVTAYAVNADGSAGSQLATTTSDASGNYTLNLAAQSGPVEIVATGGSYVEEASGATVTMGNAQIRTLVPSTTAAQQIAVTPVTEMAVQQAVSSVSSNPSVSVASLIKSANATVASAMGLTDITTPPANPTQAASAATSTQAAQYAVVLASISQLASSASTQAGTVVNSLDMMQALATSLTYNGNFNSTVSGSTAIPVPTTNGASLNLNTVLTLGGATDFSTAMNNAATTYKASTAATNLGYNAVTAPTFTTAPPVATGQVTVAPPTPPTTLPSVPPAAAGPPPVVGQTGSATVPLLNFQPNPADTGTVGYLMTIPPDDLVVHGAAITGCAVKTSTTALPTGLTIDAHTCVISGTPTGASTATYTIVATNAAGNSNDAHVTLTITVPSPHLYLSDVEFGNMTCVLDSSTGLISSCASHTGGNYYNSFGQDAVVNGSAANIYMGAGNGVVGCTANVATGVITCPNSWTQGIQGAKTVTYRTNSSGAGFVYTIDSSSNIYVCSVSSGVVGTCTQSDSGLTVPIGGQGNSSGQWKPEALGFYTTTGNTTYAYVVEDHLTGSIFQCAVDNSTGVLSGCAAMSASGLPQVGGQSQMRFQTVGSATYLYIAGYANVVKCTVTPSTGALTSCGSSAGGIPNSSAPVAITFSYLGGSTLYAYVADQSSTPHIYVCGVTTSTGALSSCTSTTATGMHSPAGISVF